MAQAPRTTGSVQNARLISANIEEARELLFQAKGALAKAVEAIEGGEVEADLKTPGLEHIQGALSLAQSALSLEASTWASYARARERTY